MSNDLQMFVPAAIKVLMMRMAPRIRTVAGLPVEQIVDLNPAISERIASGETFDIALTNPLYVRALIEKGFADAATHRPFGRVPLAVARRSESDVKLTRDAAGLVRLFRGAESIAYTGSGTSGRIYLDVMQKLGLSNVVSSKSRAVSGGVPAEMAAAGEVELAVAPLTTVLATPGVVAVAVFPDELDTHIDMSVFLSLQRATGAEPVLDWLTAIDLDDELADAGIIRFSFT